MALRVCLNFVEQNVLKASWSLHLMPASRKSSTGNDNIPSSANKLPGTLNVEEQLDMVWSNEPPIPEYKAKSGEPVEQKRARLLYQSRKRGMLENGLLLSSFADRFLHTFSPEQLIDYDILINLPSNDWEIYYWITGIKPVPPPFDTAIMRSLQDFVRNEHKENRARQPDLQDPQSR